MPAFRSPRLSHAPSPACKQEFTPVQFPCRLSAYPPPLSVGGCIEWLRISILSCQPAKASAGRARWPDPPRAPCSRYRRQAQRQAAGGRVLVGIGHLCPFRNRAAGGRPRNPRRCVAAHLAWVDDLVLRPYWWSYWRWSWRCDAAYSVATRSRSTSLSLRLDRSPCHVTFRRTTSPHAALIRPSVPPARSLLAASPAIPQRRAIPEPSPVGVHTSVYAAARPNVPSCVQPSQRSRPNRRHDR